MSINYDIIEELLPDNLTGIDLYHYTSADGLLGILNENKIRCTHIFYLNDIEENLNGWKTFFNVFDSYKKEYQSLTDFKAKIEQLLMGWRRINYTDLSNEDFKKIDFGNYRSFVFSLSQIEDDLNQWRSYTPESLSFSICFNINKDFKTNQSIFKDIDNTDQSQSNNCKILIRECVYDKVKKESIMTRLLDFYFTKYEKREPEWGAELFFNILTLCLFFKNENFKAEKECRIVVLPLSDKLDVNGVDTDIIKIRKGKSFLVPYIELDTISSCVKAITIGPTPFKHHSFQSLKIMMVNLPKYTYSVELKETKIPFRSW